MPQWIAIGAAFGVFVALWVILARRLPASAGRVAPFVLAASAVGIVYPITALAAAPRPDIVETVLLAFLGLNAVLLLRPLVRAVLIARSERPQKIMDGMNAELSNALLASMALGLTVAIVGGLGLLIYAVVTAGR